MLKVGEGGKMPTTNGMHILGKGGKKERTKRKRVKQEKIDY